MPALTWEAVPSEVRRRISDGMTKEARPLEPARDAFEALQAPLGGPDALAATLVAAGLGAGAGYLGGAAVGRNAAPYVDKRKLRRNTAIMGGALGAAVPLIGWAAPALAAEGPAGLVNGWPFKEAAAALDAEVGPVARDDLFHKAASAAGAFAPSIPVDRFNSVVLGDPLAPLPARAAVAGLVEAASASRGGVDLVSPFDVARIAVGMGSGAVSGMVVGRTLGMLAGLEPDTQRQLQRTGVFAGLVANVAPLIFGRE
jgi:hypothetical protein